MKFALEHVKERKRVIGMMGVGRVVILVIDVAKVVSV